MKQMKHWQDPVNAVLGAWLVASPWVLGFQGNPTALSAMMVFGVALIAAAAGAMWLPQAWEEWAEAALGALVIASPWLFDFSTLEVARNSAIVSGLVVLGLALWVVGTDKDWGLLRADRTAH